MTNGRNGVKDFLLSCIAVLLLTLPGSVVSQPRGTMRSVTDVYARYPERLDALLQTLDLNSEGMQQVKEAVDDNNSIKACEELLQYYRDTGGRAHLRRLQPAPASKISTSADSILNDIFTFYDLPDQVPRHESGLLDWKYQGPDDDIEWAWGLNRHAHLVALLDAYFETGNSAYARRIDEHVQDWVISSLPYPGVKSSTAQWRGLEVALRAKVWVKVFFALVNSAHLTPATQILMLASLPDHTHYMRNFHAPSGNWLTMEMSGLAMVATAWPEFKNSAAWVAYAKQKMLEGLDDQVYPDGVQKELTSHYHQVAWFNFDQFREICAQAGETLPAEYNATLEKMQHYTAYTVRPSGHGILNNDSDKRFNRDHIVEAAADYQRKDWLFIATNGKKGVSPQGPASVVFPWAGQMVMRSGYDTNAHWAFFDIGPWGTGHQHNDKLHLSVSAFGRDLLVDGGRFAYRGELARKFRRYATGSASHNVVLIDGAGQSPGPTVATEPLPAIHYRRENAFDYAWGEFDRFKDISGVSKHTRAVFYLRGEFWIVVDHIDTDTTRKIETLWHWHPDVKVRNEKNLMISTDHEKGNLRIIPVGKKNWQITQVKGQEEPFPQGWYSEKYNRSEPSVASIYSTDIGESTTFVWILQPSEGKSEPLRAKLLSRDQAQVKLRILDHRSNQWDVTVPFKNSAAAIYTFQSSLQRKSKGTRRQQREEPE